MKKLILSILLFVVCKVGMGQTLFPIGQGIGSGVTLVTSKGGLTSTVAFIFPTFSDTTAANVGLYTKSYVASTIFCTGDTAIYTRAVGATRWLKISASSGSVNIYNSDGTISANRTVSLSSFQLNFDRGSDKQFELHPTYSKLYSPNNLRIFSLYNDSVTLVGLARSASSGDSVIVRTASGRLLTRAQSAIAGATPPWQETLIAGSTLTGNNTIIGAGFDFTWSGVDEIKSASTTVIDWLATSSARIGKVSSANGTFTDDVFLNSPSGGVYMPNLANTTTQNRLVGEVTSTGQIGNVTIGSGLEMPLGVLKTTSPLSAKAYYLTQWGAVSDADISEGSISFGTDNTTAIQTVLNLASATNPIIVYVDGRFSHTGLTIKGNTQLVGLNKGDGFILRNNSDRAVIQNAGKNFTTYADSNIIIRDLVINGNGYNATFPSGAQAHDVAGEFVIGVQMYGVKNVVVNNCFFIRPRTFATHWIKDKNITVVNTNVNVGDAAPIQCDGHHFNGPSENVVIDGGVFKTEDDAVAFNADDVISAYYATAFGDIKNVVVRNIILDSSLFGVRLLSGASRMDNILVSNVTGKCRGYAIIIDNFWQAPSSLNNPGSGNFGTVQIEKVNVQVDNFTTFSIKKSLINVDCNVEKLILKDIRRNYTFANTIPTIYVGVSTTTIKSLVIDGLDSYDATAFTTPHVYVEGAVQSLSINRANLISPTAKNSSLLTVISSGSVASVNMNGVLADSINFIMQNASIDVTEINAVNIIHKSVAGPSFSTTTGGNLVLSNYFGAVKTSGSFTSTSGDAFAVAGIGGSITTNQIAVGSGSNTVAGSTFLTSDGSVVKVGTGATLALTGEVLPFQSSAASGASGSVFGTDASASASYLDLRSGNQFWHIVNPGSGSSNRFAMRSATYAGATATYSAELMSLSTSGDLYNAASIGSASLTGSGSASVQADASGILSRGPVLASGTYTPTLTNSTNLDASTAYSCQYMRVGNTVTVSGRVDIDPTLTASSTVLGISLPIASSIANANEAGGSGFCPTVAAMGAALLGDATNDRITLQFISSDVNNNAIYFSFTYRII